MAVSPTRKSRTSPKSTSAAPPRETTLEKPRSALTAQSRIAPQIAPDCETSASLPGRAGVRAKVASSPLSVRMRPMQFGPSRRTPPRRAALSIAASCARPCGPASPKPLLSTTAARMPAAAASSMIFATVRAGVAMTASSTGPGNLRKPA